MAYITSQFYAEFTGESAPPDFAVLAERASDLIDMITFQRIPRCGGIESLPSWQQVAVRKATAAQTQMLESNGGVDAITGNAEGSVSVGAYSYSQDSAVSSININGIPVSTLVQGYLGSTGLLYRGGDCFGC